MNYKTVLAVLGAALLIPTFGVAAQLGSNVSTPVVSNAATSTPDVYQVQYFRFANTAGIPDTILDIVDPGTNGLAPLCADIYVVLPDEELSECCGCPITHNQLIEGGVSALTNNPANGRAVHNGVIKIISATVPASGGCAASVQNPSPTPALRSWESPGFTDENPEFKGAGLSAAEQSFLATTCTDFVNTLSGTGICTCPVAPAQ